MDGPSKLEYGEGQDFICRAADLDDTELAILLRQHGAPDEPFCEDWTKRPYDVVKAAFEELLGEELAI